MALAVLAPASTALAGGTTTGADLQVSGSSNLGSPVQGQPYTYTTKAVPNSYIQVGSIDSVTGTVGMEVLPGDTVATPVIHATVVQAPYWVDKIA